LNAVFNCVCIAGLNKEGLLKANPTSFETSDILIPPNAESLGVLGSRRKLNTVLPPSVCAASCKDTKEKIMRIDRLIPQFQFLNLEFEI
jgi:hypothetical protein